MQYNKSNIQVQHGCTSQMANEHVRTFLNTD
jgi:hypothetical protein